jgi:hypothetical protein
MRVVVAVLAVSIIAGSCYGQTDGNQPKEPKRIAFKNGQWFDGHAFKRKDGYAVNGVLTFHRPAQVDETVDLSGQFVVPPFGEAHNHNVEPLNKVDELIKRYIEHGIFYVKNPNNLPSGRDQVAAKINRPESIDVTFSNGGFTAAGGHPAEIVKRNIDRGFWTEADGDGAFYYAIADEAELDAKWPRFLQTKPDFVKTYLLFSEGYKVRKDDAKYFGWKGLDPTLLKTIVQRAHVAGLRVSTHVESAPDFHAALVAGVDEINHLPGFRTSGDVKTHAMSEFEIAESDAQAAARQGTFIVTTLGGAAAIDAKGPDANLRSESDKLNRWNLELLKKYHVKLALGSDSYRSDTVPEALYLELLHVFDNSELLTMWCTTTANTIFPKRLIGSLKEGYEASFLVLKANPLENFDAVQQITIRVKQGHILRADQARYVGESSRSCSTAAGTTRNAKSMSACVVWRPRLKRRLARASSADMPMAVRTCEGSTAPEEQAAPVEQAKPLRSRAMRSASPSTPGKTRLAVLGVRGAWPPLMRE